MLFLDLCDFFPLQVREVFHYYFFQTGFLSLALFLEIPPFLLLEVFSFSPVLVVFLCLLLCIRLICFDSLSCGMASCVTSPVGPSGADSFCLHDLCALGVTSVWVI